MITKDMVKRAVISLYAAAAALIPVGIKEHWITADQGEAFGIGTAAFATAWHGGMITAGKIAARPREVAAPPPEPAGVAPAPTSTVLDQLDTSTVPVAGATVQP